MRIESTARRVTAALLSFALLQASLGPEAWAQLVPRVGAIEAPVGGAASAAVSVNAGRSPNSAAIMPLTAASLTVSPPSAFPSLPISAFGSAATSSGLAVPSVVPRVAPASAAPGAASRPENDAAAADSSAQSEAAVAIGGTKSESGPSAVIGSRIARRLAELKKFFSGRRDAGPEAPLFEPAAVSGAPRIGALRSNGLAPVSSPRGPEEGGKPKAAWLGLGAAGASIIAYGLTMQIGTEAQNAAMPQLTENAFKDFTLLPLVSVFSAIGSMVGQPISKFFTERFGLAKTFYGAHTLRAISLGVMVGLFGAGAMSMPLMLGFYLLNGVVTGIAAPAEGTLQKLILAAKGVSQQSYRTWRQFLAECLAVPAPIFFGALVHRLGATGASKVTILYPVTVMLGLLMAYILRVYPLKDVKKASAQAETSAPAAPAKTGAWSSFKAAAAKIFKNMEEGKNYVMSVPYLKYSLAAASAFDIFNVLIYRLIAPGYGKMTGGSAGISAVQGSIVGMYSLGGLLLSVVFITTAFIVKKRAAKNPLTGAAAASAERASMLRWAMAGIPALALLAVMAVHIALPLAPLVFLGTNWMPGSLLAAALIPFGFLEVAASIKLNSYFQERLPLDAGKVQKALAFSGSVITALSILMILAVRPLFSAVNVFNPFPWLAMALVPAGVGMFFLQRKLAAATKPEAIAAADEAQKRREAQPAPMAAGGYVGLILGIAAAAVVITAMPMIPGIAGALAALGVLAKFSVNLGLTLLIPLAGWLLGRAKGRSQAAKNASR
jgi:hypothetical protein